MSRTAAREVAVHIVYDFGFNNVIGSESLTYFLSDDFAKSISDATEISSQVGSSQHAYIIEVVNGVAEKRDEIDELIKNGKKQVEVLVAEDKWYGMTYKEDKPIVKAAIAEMTKNGLYDGI